MRVRHRIPSIFNLSMVDVLCCALGCVILLSLLNLRQAKEYKITAGKVEEERDSANKLLSRTDARLAELERERESILGQVATQTAAIRDLEGRLKAAGRQLTS